MTDNDRIEELLHSAARIVDWPEPSSDMTARISEQIGTPELKPARRVWRPRLALAALVVIFVTGTLVLVPGARQAVADLFEAAGIRLGITSEPLPAAGADLDLGVRVDLDEATERVAFDLRRPTGTPPGPADAVYINELDQVSMVWGGDESLPAAGDADVSLLLTQYPATGRPVVGSKSIGEGTSVQEVDVGGVPGLWIEGAPHTITLFDNEGTFRDESTRLAANVLLWTVDNVNLRLETTGDLAAALLIGDRLEPVR